MKYPSLLLAAGLVSFSPVNAQTDLTMTRDEFVQGQLNMMKQAKQLQQQAAQGAQSNASQVTSDKAYADYLKESERKRKQQEKKVADCLGVPVSSMTELSARIGPDFQMGVIKQCSDQLPDTINLDQLDWSSNQDFLGYKQCAETLVAKEVGVSTQRLEQCSRLAQNF